MTPSSNDPSDSDLVPDVGFLSDVLDSLSVQLAALDDSGRIIFVNKAWREFGVENGGAIGNGGLGMNYFEVCLQAAGQDAGYALVALDGLLAVAHGTEPFFEMEYPCHSPVEERWFLLRAKSLAERSGLVVTHTNITSRKRVAEEEAARRAEATERARQSLEIQVLDSYGPAPTPITSRLYGQVPLREGAPARFEEFRAWYAEVFELALERRAYRVEHNTSERLRLLGGRLAACKAGPRDVIDIHSSVLKEKVALATLERTAAYLEEGRLLVLELMGFLATYYRGVAVGVVGIPDTSAGSDDPETRER